MACRDISSLGTSPIGRPAFFPVSSPPCSLYLHEAARAVFKNTDQSTSLPCSKNNHKPPLLLRYGGFNMNLRQNPLSFRRPLRPRVVWTVAAPEATAPGVPVRSPSWHPHEDSVVNQAKCIPSGGTSHAPCSDLPLLFCVFSGPSTP